MAVSLNDMGSLRSKVNLTLHTYHATRAWWGRGVESGKAQIIGMRQLLFLIGRIQQDAARDDPYADLWLLEVEQKLEETRKQLDTFSQDAERMLEMIPRELTIEENVNQKPFVTPVYTGGQLGWLAIRLLIDFDRYVRNILLAAHVALLNRDDKEALLRQANHLIRSLCTAPQRYPGYSGITRDDLAANNARARDVIAQRGVLPEDIARGTKRSQYAPMIRPSQAQDQGEPEMDEPDTVTSDNTTNV